MRTIIVGSRQSALALTQTGQVIEHLQTICEEQGVACRFEVKKIVTKGDRILDVTLSKVGGKGLFVKEIEQALLDKEIDIAVHSMKDMPAVLPEGLRIGAVPKREDPRDCLVSVNNAALHELPASPRIGTSSLRRACQIKAYRPDAKLESIRGNIDSRLRKLETEGFDAIMLAAAGLHRMGWNERISSYVPTDVCVPAVGQGALGIECRSGDEQVLSILAHYNDKLTELAVSAERSYLARLNGGCQIPIGAHAQLAAGLGEHNSEPPMITLTGIVGSDDGDEMLKETMQGTNPHTLGTQLAERLLERGAERILGYLRG